MIKSFFAQLIDTSIIVSFVFVFFDVSTLLNFPTLLNIPTETDFDFNVFLKSGLGLGAAMFFYNESRKRGAEHNIHLNETIKSLKEEIKDLKEDLKRKDEANFNLQSKLFEKNG